MKRCLIRIILLTCAVLGFAAGASAQSAGDSTTVQRFRIMYPLSETKLYEDYMGNTAALQSIREHLQKSPRIDSVVIYSYASPEGPLWLNIRLAEERGKRARQYLLEHMPSDRNIPTSRIIVRPTPENWEGLYTMVMDSYPYDDKLEVLTLLSRKDITDKLRKELLKGLNGGRPWEYIRTNFLPKLRYATWIAEWVHVPTPMDDIPPMPPISLQLDPVTNGIRRLPPEIPVREESGRKTILALKTNLLYDVLSLVNFSIEAPIYKDKVSLLYYHQFPWWTWGLADNEYCVRFLSIGAEARYWFNPSDRFNGHFLGLYGESGKYDFERRRDICYQGEFYSAGLTYGYAMPIGKHLNMEFSLSAGYASVAYRGYTPSEDYEILWRDPDKVGRLHYFGPTKAQISLVLPIRVKTKGGKNL